MTAVYDADQGSSPPAPAIQSAEPPARDSGLGLDLVHGLAAGAIAVAAFVISGVVRGTYPFGSVSRSTNDLGQQFIPMHAHFREIITGGGGGDLWFNWASGLGVPFLADFMTYVGTSLSWFVVAFPAERIDLAVYTITLVALGTAAAAMTGYLRRLRPEGPAWLAIIAGASYASCGWAVDDAAYVTTWMYGLIAFPMLLLVAEWVITKRSVASLVVGPFVIALFWTSNYYTAYMATLGAGIVVLARLLSLGSKVSWRSRGTAVARLAFVLLAGIGLAAPLLVPTFRAVQTARPSPESVFVPVSWQDFMSRLLPGTEGVGLSPGLAVGTLMLLLAVSLPFNRAVPARDRVVWTATIVVTVLSMQIAVTHAIWHGFDVPNGSAYRQAFVVAGMLVMAGWLSAAATVRNAAAMVVPLVAVGTLYAVVYGDRFVTPTTRVMVPLVTGVILLAGLFGSSSRSGRSHRRVAVAAVGAVVFAEIAASAVAIDEQRSETFGAAPAWNERHQAVRDLVLSAANWPHSRTSPGGNLTVNDPMLLGGQGAEYYSSAMPNAVSEMLASFGFGYTAYGRAQIDPGNPVADAVFSVARRAVLHGDGNGGAGFVLATQPAAPLVTVRASAPWHSTDPVPFGAHETALGADVYVVPEVEMTGAADVAVAARSNGDLVLTPAAGVDLPVGIHAMATCAAESEVYLYAPSFVGEVQIDGQWTPVLRPGAKRPGVYSGAAMMLVGVAGPDGAVDVPLRITGPARIPGFALGCLDPGKLVAAVEDLADSAPPSVDVGGHAVHATLEPSPDRRMVVLGMVRVPGWQCATGDGPGRTPQTLAGLMAVTVPPGDLTVSCSFRPPGLRLGLALAALSLTALIVGCAVLWHRQSRRSRRELEIRTSPELDPEPEARS